MIKNFDHLQWCLITTFANLLISIIYQEGYTQIKGQSRNSYKRKINIIAI